MILPSSVVMYGRDPVTVPPKQLPDRPVLLLQLLRREMWPYPYRQCWDFSIRRYCSSYNNFSNNVEGQDFVQIDEGSDYLITDATSLARNRFKWSIFRLSAVNSQRWANNESDRCDTSVRNDFKASCSTYWSSFDCPGLGNPQSLERLNNPWHWSEDLTLA